MKLSDGTIAPNHCAISDTSQTSQTSTAFGDISIRMGVVYKAIYPSETTNENIKEIIYLVNVRYRNGTGPMQQTTYRCRLSSSFESMADYSRVTLRPPDTQKNGQIVGDGAKVLVACPNGSINEGFIIGCIKNAQARPDRKRKRVGKVNRQYESEFNGVHMLIDDDGSLTFTVNGATTYVGGPDPERDANNKGTKIQVQKNGTVVISDERGATKNTDGTSTYNKDDPGEVITLNTVTKTIDVQSGHYNQGSPGNWTVNVKGNAVLKAKGDVVIGGKAKNIYIGETSAKENLVLGKKLVAALQMLIQILTKPPLGDPAVPGKPVLMEPGKTSELLKWMKDNLIGAPASILAKNKYTER